MNRIDKLTAKLIGKAKVLVMGRKSKREKRLARHEAQKRLITSVNFPKDNNAGSAGASVATKETVLAKNYQVYQGLDWQHMINDHSHYPTLVCSVGELNLWGATKDEIYFSDMKYIDLVVNCSQMALTIGKTAPHITGNKHFETLNKHVKQVNEVLLDWSDGSGLPVTLDFWLEFYDICVKQGYRNILFCCMGGHGRTGTGLACLVLANSAYEFNMSEKLVDLVKARYCNHAIETITQENYLEELEKEKKDRPEARVEAVIWNEYKPRVRRDNKYTTRQGNNNNSSKLEPKTLTEVIRQAQANEDRKGDIFNGKGDTSAVQLNSLEESQAANKAIVIDMLSKEERATKDAEVRQKCKDCEDYLYTERELKEGFCYKCRKDKAREETMQCIEDYENEQKELKNVKTRTATEYKCFCTTDYECLACEWLRTNGEDGALI